MLAFERSPRTPTLVPALVDFCKLLELYLAERVDPLAIDRAGTIPPMILTELAGLGAFGVSLPEAHGGSGLGLVGACAVVETLAYRDRALATTIGLHLGLGTRGLVAFGSERQHARWLPDLAAGASVAAFSATEPGAGSDLSRLQTRVTRAGSGHLQVDGQKIYVTNGGLAHVYTIAAASPELSDAKAGASLVVLERGDTGLVIGPEEKKLGLRGSSTTPLYLDAVRIPDERLLGQPGHGQELVSQVLAWGRTIMSAGCTGTAAAAVDLATRHVAMRRQFGRTLGDQPVVRAQLADMAADLCAMRALVLATAACENDPRQLESLSIAAKIYCSETDWAICDRAVQLLGGSGYIEDSGAPLLLRDARITRIFEGANDVLLSRLGTIELLHPRTFMATGTAADAIALEVASIVAAWKETFGLRVLRNPQQLHWLGRLVVVRDTAQALAQRLGKDATESELALPRHALKRAERARQFLLLESSDTAASDIICRDLFGGVSA